MAFINILIELPSFPIGECNNRTIFPNNTSEALRQIAELLTGINGGNYPASVEVTTLSSDPEVATDGGASTQETYDHR